MARASASEKNLFLVFSLPMRGSVRRNLPHCKLPSPTKSQKSQVRKKTTATLDIFLTSWIFWIALECLAARVCPKLQPGHLGRVQRSSNGRVPHMYVNMYMLHVYKDTFTNAGHIMLCCLEQPPLLTKPYKRWDGLQGTGHETEDPRMLTWPQQSGRG